MSDSKIFPENFRNSLRTMPLDERVRIVIGTSEPGGLKEAIEQIKSDNSPDVPEGTYYENLAGPIIKQTIIEYNGEAMKPIQQYFKDKGIIPSTTDYRLGIFSATMTVDQINDLEQQPYVGSISKRFDNIVESPRRPLPRSRLLTAYVS